MFTISWPHIIVILIIVFLLFGKRKLPQLGSDLGEAIKNFRKAVTEAERSAASKEDTGQGKPSSGQPGK